ncbi:MAG: hypothetical protein K0Q43_253 [Ramlibacter sp.]|nr:hypothetical protein [Ramlibacter sp.]
MADHACDAQAALRDHAVFVEVAAMEIRVGDDRAACDFVEGDVLGREVRRTRHHDRVAHAPGVLQRPRQCLHAAQAAAHHSGQRLDAEAIEQPGLCVDPVLHRHHGEIGAVHLAGVGVRVHRSGRAEARAEVVDANDEETVGVDRLAWADHRVPPAFGVRLPLVDAGHVVRGVEGMADQHGVALVGVERAVGLVGQQIVADRRAALQRKRLGKRHRRRRDKHEKNPASLKRRGRVFGLSDL